MSAVKNTCIALAVLTLTGCATMDRLSDEPARWQASSQKTVNQYVACVAPAWAGISAETKVLPIEGGQRVLVPSGGAYSFGNVVVMLDVTGTSAAQVALRSKVEPRRFVDAAQSCI